MPGEDEREARGTPLLRYEVELRREAPRAGGEAEPWRPMRRAVRGGGFEPVAFASLAEARDFLRNAPSDLARVVGVGEDGGRAAVGDEPRAGGPGPRSRDRPPAARGRRVV